MILDLLKENDSVGISGCYYPVNGAQGQSCHISIEQGENGFQYSMQITEDDGHVKNACDSSRVMALIDGALVRVIFGTVATKTHIYEDKTGIFRACEAHLKGRLVLIFLEDFYRDAYYETIHKMKYPEKLCAYDHFYQRISKRDVRMGRDEALQYLTENPQEFALKSREPIDMNDPVISISKPDITRKSDNKDKATFDFVSVEIWLRTTLNIKDMNSYIKENIKMLNGRALASIAGAKSYQRYGVPVSYLKLYGVGSHANTMVRLMYELKTFKK